MIQNFINKQFYNLFIFTYIFGLVLYGIIGFESIDEICALILVIMFIFSIFKTHDWNVDKLFIATMGVFMFYTMYSFYIHSNSAKGIFTDLIIQLKPYIGFFAVYYMRPKFTPSQKKLLINIIYIVWFFMVIIGIISIFNIAFMQHTVGLALYAGIITASALLYLYCSNGTKLDKILFLILLSAGLLSFRSKFYGFFILAIVMTVFLKNLKHLKINLKTIFIVALSLFTIFIASKQKIVLYFGTGNMKSIPESLAARASLYVTSLNIFKDYFPFGSGLASFGTYASGVYYSPIYAQYGIENIKGISKRNYSYIADTYYPCLAQFGVVGAILYFVFFLILLRKAYKLYMQTDEEKYFIIPFLIIGYLLIENIADATFSSSRGLFIMMFLGLVLSDNKTSRYEHILTNRSHS